MQEELDYLEETIPKQTDEGLINILAANAAAYSQLAVDFAVEELRNRGFRLEQTDHGFDVATPAGGEFHLPREAGTQGETGGAYARAVRAGAARERELAGVGGWLGLLIFDLVILRPLAFLLVVYVLGLGVDVISYYPALGWLAVLDRVTGMAIACAGIYAGVKLYGVRPGAVEFTKRFLTVSAACVTVVSGLIYLAAADTGVPAIKETAGDIPGFIIAAWVSWGVWYSYLTRSKRVAVTYGEATNQGA